MPPATDNLIARLQTGADVVLVPDAIAEGYVPPREAAVGLRDVNKRQVLVVAQNRRNGDQQPGAFLARLDQHAHVHLFLQEVSRVFNDHAHLYRTGVGVHEG